MKRQWLTILILLSSVYIVSYLVGSCKKHDIVHFTTSLQQVIPDGFPQPVYRFEDNPLTEEGFQIGRKLFYDRFPETQFPLFILSPGDRYFRYL
jgi:cytochrome c peroxidase